MTGNLPENVPGWVDSHCHIPGADAADARRRGRRRRRDDDGHRRLRPRVVAGGAAGRGAVPGGPRHRRAAPARGAPRRRDDRRPVRRGRRWPWGSAASTTTTTTRRATTSGRPSPPRSRSPTDSALPLVIHTREAWDDTFAILDAEGVPARTDLPLLHRRTRRGAPVPRPRRLRQLLRDRHVPRRSGGARGRGARAARAHARRDRQPVPRPGPPPRQAQPTGVGAPRRRPPRRDPRRPGRGGSSRHQRRGGSPRRLRSRLAVHSFSSLTWAGTGDRPRRPRAGP